MVIEENMTALDGLTVCRSHPSITNGLHLEDFMLVRQGIKCKVQAIQHLANFDRWK